MMSLKRSCNSSSCNLVAAAGDEVKRLQSPEKKKKKYRSSRRCSAVFNIWSGDMEMESDRGQIESSLDQCGVCKRKLSQNDPLFMYGDLGAFCSTGCRGKRIAYDKLVELMERIESKKRRTGCEMGMNDYSEDQKAIAKQRKPNPSSSTTTMSCMIHHRVGY